MMRGLRAVVVVGFVLCNIIGVSLALGLVDDYDGNEVQCAPLWGQCGGKNWNGTTCCVGKCICTKMNELFSRCDPPAGKNTCGTGPPTPPTPQPPTPPPTPGPPTPPPGCKWECGLNGICDTAAEKCNCDPGWTGAFCTRLDVKPVPPTRVGYRNASMPTWSGDVVYEKATKTYHFFVDARAQKSTQLQVDDSYTCNSKTVRLEAKYPDGPYHYVEDVLPRMHYNPHVAEAPDGTLLMFVCGNPDSPDPDTPDGRKYCANCWLSSHESIRMSTSKGPRGPWSNSRAVFNAFPGPTDRTQWDCTSQNPAVVILKNGTVVMAYRGHACVDHWPQPAQGPPNEYIGLATAPSWQCLVNLTCNFTRASNKPLFSTQDLCSKQMTEWLGGCNVEDPVFWADKRGFHMLFHGGNISAQNYNYWTDFAQVQGAYAYAKDALGPWTLVPNSVDSPWPAHTPSPLIYTNGTKAVLWRRQKPGLIFGANGSPTHVINGVDLQHTGSPSTAGCFWQTGWTLVQPLGNGSHAN